MVPSFHSKKDRPGSGPVSSVSTEAGSAESGKIAPEEDVEGQQQDGIDVADASPERLLGDAGQLPLASGRLLGAMGGLGAACPAEPVPQQPAPPPTRGWGPQPGAREAEGEVRPGGTQGRDKGQGGGAVRPGGGVAQKERRMAPGLVGNLLGAQL